MHRSYSLGPQDAEPVVRAHLLDVLASNGSAVAEVEDADRLDRSGLDELAAAWLITQLRVATGVDPFADGKGLAQTATVGELVGLYRAALEEAAALPAGPPPAAVSPDSPDPPRRALIGQVAQLGADRYAAPLLAPAASASAHADAGARAADRRLAEEALLEAARQLWTAAVARARGPRMRPWADRIEARFTAPVFPADAGLECGIRTLAREPLCERVAADVEVRQGGARAAVLEVELRVMPAAVARTFEALRARRAAPKSDQ